ncbi:Cell morphogenesis N-terminal [Rhizoctonia solani]|uniref:Cell morphogenesis N-terminal n=1 Tax=Rhizoctonia solani TaxID=456999 RepID=A0A8H7LI20_9AGAM|nr:Cell morphogenesis N-terminal [Rhizoctonia solani]
MQIEIPDFDDDDYTPGATPFGRSTQPQLGRVSPTPSHPFGDHGQSTMFTLPAQNGGSLPTSSLLSAAPVGAPTSAGNSNNGGGMFSVSNGSGIFAPPGHARGESDTSIHSFHFDPPPPPGPPRTKRKGSFASLKAAFKSGTSGKSAPPVPKSQPRRPSASVVPGRVGMKSMHSAAPSYAASEFSDGGGGNSSFGGFGGFNGFNITTNSGFGPADEEVPPVPQLPGQSSAPRDLSSGGFKFGGIRPRNISTSVASQAGGSTADFNQNVPIPRPPRRATTPHENDDATPDPKTPAEYALHAVFIRFVTEVEQKTSAFLKEPLHSEPLLSTILGPGADRQFDSTLDSLAHIALKHTRLVIDALARWRRTQRLIPTSAQIRVHTQRHQLGHGPTHSDTPSATNLSTTLGALNPGGLPQSGSGYGYVYSQSEVTKVLAERMELMTVYVLSRALLVVLASVSELGKDVLGEGMGASLEENSFEPVRNPDLKRLALSGNHRANAELYASLLGQIANIRFQSVTDRYLRELEPVAAGQVLRDHDARYEHIVEGLKHIRIKVWPPEAFEEGAEFMETLSKSFANAHGTRLKIAFVKSLVEILHPIGKTAQAEVNHPGWAKAIDLIYPKAREMITKPRYFAVAYPLVISSLCVAPQDFFAKNWMACIDLSIAKMKQEKQSRVMCLNGILRIVWTYLYRCHEPSSTATSKLDIVLKHLFPPKGQSIFPPDESLECHEYIVHFILSRHFDYGIDIVMEFLQESEALGNGTLDLNLPFRPIIALRAILLTLTAMEKDSKPVWPSNVDFTTYDTQDDYTYEATFLSEAFYTKPGVKTFFERYGPVIGKLAMVCAQAVGHLTLSDERFLRTNYSFEEGEQLVFKRRGELSVAYPRHLDPQVYFLMVCFESWPRCLHSSISIIDTLDLLIKSLNHVDAGLAEAASSALRRIAANEQHVKAAVWRCTRYLFSPPIQPGNRDTSALRMVAEQEYVVPLWTDLVGAWAEQLEKPPEEEANDSDSVKVDSGELAQEIEGGALCLLSSVSQSLRALAVKILLLSVRLIPNAQKRSHGSQTSPTNSETRVCNILLGKGVSIATIFERREHAPPEKYRRKFLQWQQNKDPNCLLRLAQSKDEEDLRIWTYVFPAITQECMVRSPHALEYARMTWNAWIVRFHPIVSTIAGISSKVAAAAPLARPTRQGSGASEDVEDRRDGHALSVEQWRCWIIALCSCAIQSDARPTPAREHGRMPSDPASQRERLTTARGLFRLIIPFLSSDQARFRDAVTTALGSVHLSTFKTVLEDLQSITRHIYDEFRSTAANRSAQTARRARSQDRLYVAVAQVHQLTAHFLRDPKSLSDQGALHFMLQFVRETKTFLSQSDIKQDCDSHRLRRLFCGVVENLFDALSNRKDIDRFMWPHARLELFHLCQEWCIYGPASSPVRQRHAAMRANATRYGTVALYDSECEQLVEAVPAALASLCAGAFFYIDKTTRSPGKHVHPEGPSPLTVHEVLDWINASLEHPSESVNASGRKALKSLLTYPARNEELLDDICRRAFASLHTMPGSTPSFGVVADVILTCTDSPFSFSQVVCLALASLGDTDHRIRKHGFDVLEAIHRQTSRVHFIAESEAAIRSYAPSVYLPGQRRISEFLAIHHSEEAVPLLAQCALHLSNLREGEALVLHALEPWMAYVELMAEGTNDLLPTGDLCMHNLLALTIRFGDTHPSEMQALWTKLVAGTHPMNHHAIVKWLIEQATWLGNAAFVAYSRRVIAYLSRTQFGELVFHELCSLISPATMSIQKANIPKRPRSHLFTADLSTLLPLSESRKQLSIAQLALLFLGDVALDPSWDISYQLPIFLHAIFLQTDHKSASVEQEIHHLLLQTLRTCTAVYEDNGLEEISREDVKSSISRLADQSSSEFWLSDEPGILDMEKLCFEVLRLLEPSRPRLRQEWGLLSLEWGAHSSDASTASLSLQLLRILRPRVQQGALNELLARLTNTVASNDSGPQKVCQDVLMSLTALVKADVLDHTLWPQLFWCARACLSTTVEAEYAQALILLKTLLQVLDITKDEVIEDLLDYQPESWDTDDISLQAVILPGLRSSATWKDAMEVLKSLSRCTHDQFVDPSAGRLRSLYTICLPPFLEAMDQSQLDEDLAELAMNIARMADNEKRVGISRLMTSFAKQKFRTKEDFLRQAVSCLRENYTSKHSTEILTLLLGLVLNSERWLRVKSMQLLKLLFQHVETKNQNVLSELLMPLLSLLRTDLALQALDVLDEPLSVSGGLAATHVLRMSMHIRSSRELEGNLVVFGVPEPSGWCVARPLEMAALCRRNVQALYESLSATASARPMTMAFSVALDGISTNGTSQLDEFGMSTDMDDDLGNLVSQLNDLNSFFTTEGTLPEPIAVSPVPPSAPINFQNEAERRVAAILSRSLAKSGARGDSISSMEGIGHTIDRERGDKGPGTPYIGLFEMSTPHRDGDGDGDDTPHRDGNGNGRDDGRHDVHAHGYLSESDGEEAGYEADSYLSHSQSHNHPTPSDELAGHSYPPSSFISASREETPVARFAGLSQYDNGPDSDIESDDDRKGVFGLESPRQKLNANRRSSGGLRSLFGSSASHNPKEGESRAMAAFGGTVNMSMNVASSRNAQRFDRRKRI